MSGAAAVSCRRVTLDVKASATGERCAACGPVKSNLGTTRLAAGPGHDISGSGMLCNIPSECAALLFGPIERPLALEQQCFDYGMHCVTIRLRRIDVQPMIQEAESG